MRFLATLLLAAATLFAQAPAAVKKVPAYKLLKYPPLGEIKVPEIDSFVLSNGMRVYLLEDHALPLINGLALVRTGSLFDPPNKTGLGAIAGQVMRTGGTKSKSGDELDVQLESIAAGVESAVSESIATVSFNCLKENTDEVLGVFFDVLTQPEFRQDKIDLLKTQYRSAIQRRFDQPDSIAGEQFSEIVYGRNTPFGRDVEYETLDNIHRKDLVEFHERYYFPANIRIAIRGDFDKSAMRARLEQIFSGWKVQQPPVPEIPQVTNQAKSAIYLGERDDVAQSFFSLGQLGGRLDSKDYAALEVLSDILSGGFDSRLFKRVRTQLGYAYHIGGGWGAQYDYPGLFSISGSVKSSATTETLEEVMKEVARVRIDMVSEEELQGAKDKVLNSFVFNFDKPAKTLSRLMRYEYYGYPKDFHLQYQKAVAAVTRGDVLRVAKQYIDPSKFVFTVVGNPKEFKAPLSDLKVPLEKLDLKVKEPAKEAAPVSAEGAAKARQTLSRMQTAVGGADKLAAVKDVVMINDAKLGPMAVKQRNFWIAPGQFRQEQDTPMGKIMAFYDGKTGFIVHPQAPQGMPIPAPFLKQIKDAMFTMLPSLLLSDRLPGRTVNALDANNIEITDDASGGTVKLTMDPSTGLPAKYAMDTVTPQGKMLVEYVYGDWRPVGDLKMPFLNTILQNGAKQAELKVESIEINKGLKPEEITKK